MKELEAFAESANAYNRLILRHLSISEAFEPPTFRNMDCFNRLNDEDDEDAEPIFRLDADGDSQCMFQIGEMSDDASSGEDDVDHAPMLWMGLSPPGDSSLARRRSAKKDGTVTEQMMIPVLAKNRSPPPKVLSSIF